MLFFFFFALDQINEFEFDEKKKKKKKKKSFGGSPLLGRSCSYHVTLHYYAAGNSRGKDHPRFRLGSTIERRRGGGMQPVTARHWPARIPCPCITRAFAFRSNFAGILCICYIFVSFCYLFPPPPPRIWIRIAQTPSWQNSKFKNESHTYHETTNMRKGRSKWSLLGPSRSLLNN